MTDSNTHKRGEEQYSDKVQYAIRNCIEKKLKMLELNDCNLSKFPYQLFSAEHLTSLSVFGNFITELPGDLKSCSQLRELNIGHNQIKTLNGEVIGYLQHLERLEVGYNQLE